MFAEASIPAAWGQPADNVSMKWAEPVDGWWIVLWIPACVRQICHGWR